MRTTKKIEEIAGDLHTPVMQATLVEQAAATTGLRALVRASSIGCSHRVPDPARSPRRRGRAPIGVRDDLDDLP
jgi:hypothetical protein